VSFSTERSSRRPTQGEVVKESKTPQERGTLAVSGSQTPRDPSMSLATTHETPAEAPHEALRRGSVSTQRRRGSLSRGSRLLNLPLDASMLGFGAAGLQ
jgi:hypothetical protein